MTLAFSRRQFLQAVGAAGLFTSMHPLWAAQVPSDAPSRIGAAWRGPKPDDPQYAGVLEADWANKTLRIVYAVPLPTRPHGLVAEAGGGLLITGVRPGSWLLRCDGHGNVIAQADLREETDAVRLSGHVAIGAQHVYTAEIDYKTDRGRIGVRDPITLAKQDEWSSSGIEPHQILLDSAGDLWVANGGVPRTLADQKYDLHRMDAALVQLEGRNGALKGRWTLPDSRLSLRHLAFAQDTEHPRLGIAMQAEHDSPAERAQAPTLAVFEQDRLYTPCRSNDGTGYCGDIVAAHNGGFVLSSNKAGVAQWWNPAQPELLSTIVSLKDSYALAEWLTPDSGGVLVATGIGLVRWHPVAPPAFLPWPQPMALDNHWIAMGAA